MLQKINYILLSVLCTFTFKNTTAQSQQSIDDQLKRVRGEGILNTITTAVPFLMISPDSRAGGMGDVGAATTADANSSHWNNSKYAFIESNMGLSFSYVPWLKNLVPDINMSYLSGYKRINEQMVVSGSIRYFTLGEINLTDEGGNTFQVIKPNETAADAGIAYKLSEKFSGGFKLRYVHSNLTQGVSTLSDTKAARAVAADLSGFYTTDIKVSNYNSKLNFGFNISNIGNKVSYSEAARRDFIPINMRLGTGLVMELDEFNTFGLYADVNKLLVPTSPVLLRDDNNNVVIGDDGEPAILAGKNPNVSVPVGMIQSFYDAPGGFREEFSEYTFSLGAEYWYDKQFAMRAGYFYENPNKGNRKYLTVGAGIKYEMLYIDFSYLVSLDQRNPLENTVRFTLKLDLDQLKKSNDKN
jgi:hypothetical protein